MANIRPVRFESFSKVPLKSLDMAFGDGTHSKVLPVDHDYNLDEIGPPYRVFATLTAVARGKEGETITKLIDLMPTTTTPAPTTTTTTPEPTTTTTPEPTTTTTVAPTPAPIADFKWHEQGVGVYGNVTPAYLVSSGNVAFKDYSTGGTPTSWSWQAWNYTTSAYVEVSTIAEFVFTYATWYPTYQQNTGWSKRMKIKLTATNAGGSSSKEYTIDWAIPTTSD